MEAVPPSHFLSRSGSGGASPSRSNVSFLPLRQAHLINLATIKKRGKRRFDRRILRGRIYVGRAFWPDSGKRGFVRADFAPVGGFVRHVFAVDGGFAWFKFAAHGGFVW
jgi:hypothetical protein